MHLAVEAYLGFTLDQASAVLLQVEPASSSGQRVLENSTSIEPCLETSRVEAQDGIGERIWLNADGALRIKHRARVLIERHAPELSGLVSPDPHSMPGCAVPYLFDTRYCFAERFQPFVASEFSGTQGGARVAAIAQWIADNFTYAPGISTPETTALDTFVQRAGVCRDYTHVLVSLVRASGIPARYVACYGPQVEPQDFHAVAQVLLHDPISGEDSWQLVDATGMSSPSSTAIIGVGRDAADVSFLTSFGPCSFDFCEVRVTCDE